MTRSLFLMIAAMLVGVFGLVMVFATAFGLQNSGLGVSNDTVNLGRALGTLIVSVSILNFLVRNHPDSRTLEAVLGFNVIVHLLGLLNDLWGMANGTLQFGHLLPGVVLHLFVIAGSVYFGHKLRRNLTRA